LVFALPAEASAQRRIVRRTYATNSASVSLIEAGRKWGVMSIRTGRQDPVLQAAAEAHAAYQARLGVQGHQLWDRRRAQLRRALPQFNSIEECANESWPGQNEAAAANEMFNSWRKSRGHWGYVNGACEAWGYAMAYSPRKRTWYACGIFARRR
jgi:hypothetical protein